MSLIMLAMVAEAVVVEISEISGGSEVSDGSGSGASSNVSGGGGGNGGGGSSGAGDGSV